MTELLFPTPDNPVPPGASAQMLTMRDGKRLRIALFATEARPLRGTVLVLTGRNECVEKYFETVQDLTARGFTVAVFDWRGQGHSDRVHRDPIRGHIRSFDQYVDDLDQVFGEILLPDCRGPYYVLGHSTGALIALLAAPRLTNRVRRMVLSAPLLTLTGFPIPMPAIGLLANVLLGLGLGGRLLGPQRDAVPFEANQVTSDPVRYKRNRGIFAAHPQLATGGPTVRWVRSACRAAARVQEQAFVEKFRVPTLFVAAGADTIVSTPAVEAYARRLRSGSVLVVDGARHELLQERDIFRAQFLAAFDAFVPGTE
jgi:lysophospholipase